MFKWASKQKERSRQKYLQQTVSRSQNSPAHSHKTFKSSQSKISQTSYKRISLKKPIKTQKQQVQSPISRFSYETLVTPQKQKDREYIIKSTQVTHDNSHKLSEFNSNKKQLSDFLNNKLHSVSKKLTKPSLNSHTHNKKIIIKLASHNNLMLNQYKNALYDIKQKKWNAYVFANILLKMGFIFDLVNDRYIVKQLWQQLNYPCPLGTYAFLQKIMGNRIDIDQAKEQIRQILDDKFFDLSIRSAQSIIHNNQQQNLVIHLKMRRMSRKQGIHY